MLIPILSTVLVASQNTSPKPLQIHISTKHYSYQLNHSIPVEVVLTNPGPDNLSFSGSASVYLLDVRELAPADAKNRYYASPLRLDTFRLIDPNAASVRTITARSSFKVRLDLSKLVWEKCKSAVWPHKVFSSVVDPGTYLLSFVLYEDPSNESFVSNTVTMQLQGK